MPFKIFAQQSSPFTLLLFAARSTHAQAELAQQSDTVITMLPSTPHVEGTFLDAPGGLLANMKRPGVNYIDCSTIDPVASKALHGKVAAAGGFMLDAPVSGGVGGAGAGTLTFMVGGEGKVVADNKGLLMDMGTNVVHCGAAGTGEVHGFVIFGV